MPDCFYEVLEYYKKPSHITDLSRHLDFINWLTDDIPSIYQVVQGLIVHGAWLRFYGIQPEDNQRLDFNLPYAEDLFNKLLLIEKSSLAIPRSPEKRVIASCREYAVLFCAILRNKGIPSRCRCGFATYLAEPGCFEDHWICEYWNGTRWVMVDPQIDPFQLSNLRNWATRDPNVNQEFRDVIYHLNPLDLSPSDFIIAGEAWKKCRNGTYDSNIFGIYGDPKEFGLESLSGSWFIRGNLLRDFASLNKVETVPFLNRVSKKLNWASWRLISANDDELTNDDRNLLDDAAEVTMSPDFSFARIQSMYKNNIPLQVPDEIIRNSL